MEAFSFHFSCQVVDTIFQVESRIVRNSIKMSHINLLKVYLNLAFLLIAIQFSLSEELFNEDNYRWKAYFENTSITMRMGETRKIHLKIMHFEKIDIVKSNVSVRLTSSWDNVKVHPFVELEEPEYDKWNEILQSVLQTTSYMVLHGQFTVDAHFIGNVQVFVEIVRNGSSIKLPQQMEITVKHRKCDFRELKQYTKYFFIIFNLILYVNFGLVLDLVKVRDILRNPYRTLIAYMCNFFILPLVRFYEYLLYCN